MAPRVIAGRAPGTHKMVQQMTAQPAARKEFVKFAPCEPSAYFLLS